MVGIFDCGGVLGKYEIRLKERKVVNMEALNTYKTEKTLAEQMNERLAEMKMTKAEAALKMNYSRAALSQYLNGKYASDPTELEKKVREFLAATGGVAEGQEPENSVPTGAGTLKKKVEFFESRDFVQTIGVCQACQEYMGLGIIVGKSGQGKTHALKKYAELPRVASVRQNGELYEATLKILDKNKQPDIRFPEVPKVKTDIPVLKNEIVAIVLMYGECKPYIIGRCF